jgi:hypothetical protein
MNEMTSVKHRTVQERRCSRDVVLSFAKILPPPSGQERASAGPHVPGT